MTKQELLEKIYELELRIKELEDDPKTTNNYYYTLPVYPNYHYLQVECSDNSSDWTIQNRRNK